MKSCDVVMVLGGPDSYVMTNSNTGTSGITFSRLSRLARKGNLNQKKKFHLTVNTDKRK
jgi:hypothetical protein